MLKVNFTFDEKTYRHAVNGHESVLHCHHYMCLTTKLAHNFAVLGGVRILRETAEDSIRPLLDSYISENKVASPDERLNVGREYYSVCGMGQMEIIGDESGGQVKLSHSHVDEGWQKKWGKSDKPVNDFSCGFIAAIFAAASDKPARSYEAAEEKSMAAGESCSVITVKKAK